MRRLLIAAALLVLPISAQAQATDSYAGLDYFHGFYEPDNGEDLNPGGLRFLYGYNLNSAFSFEFAYFNGLTSDETNDGNDFDVDEGFGNYLRGAFPVNKVLNVYARLGLTALRFERSNASGGSWDQTDLGYSYGLGLDYRLGGDAYLNVDYTIYLDDPADNSYRFSALAVGGRVRF